MKKVDERKKSKRSKAKYPGLVPRLTSRVRQEYHDFDYIDSLDEEAKEFLNRFIEEELNASFKNDDRDLNQETTEKRKIYNQNNARNRDLYGLIKGKVANTKLLNYEDSLNIIESEMATQSPENSILDYLESQDLKAFIIEYQEAMSNFKEVVE
jgi:hypothetical protein